MAAGLQATNVGLLLVGGLCLAGLVIRLFRSGRWRTPLAGIEIPAGGPTAAGLLAVLLAYIAVQFAALRVLAPDLPPGGELEPGTDAWHRMQAADAVTKLLLSVLMAALLVWASSRAAARERRMGLLKSSAFGIVALLILLPVATAQLEAGRFIWTWLHPECPPPLHNVLRALSRSAWGGWGTVQLLVGAVLIAPVAEELFFRGVVLQAVCHHHRRAWPAIVLSAVAFGLVHAQPQDILPLATLGIVLGYLRLRCGSLWPCVLVHVLFNARTMMFAVLAPELVTQT